MSTRVSLAVYDRAGVTMASADFLGADGKPAWKPAQEPLLFTDELDDAGFFAIEVQADAVDLSEVQAGHILAVLLDATVIWRGLIRKFTHTEIGADAGSRTAVIAGVGEVGRLEEMVVYPTGGLGRFPMSDDRRFDWTAPEFPDSGWDTPVETPANYGTSTENFGLAEGMPYGTAEWIWDVDVSAGSIPAEVKEMRKSGVTVAADGVFEAWGAADDRFEAYVEGTSVLKSSDAPYDGSAYAAELFITAGAICVAARAENRNTLKAGLNFGIGKPLEAGDTPIVVTDDTWKIRPDGATLGMNAGHIMSVLLDEFTARGGTAPAVTFSETLDSNGDAWVTTEEVVVPVGSSYLDVLRQLVELEMCDFRMSTTGFELNLYNAGAAGSTVAYTLGDNSLTSLTWESAPAVSTALLTRWARGWTDEDDTALVTAHGRREAMLSLGGVTSEATAQTQADVVIARFGDDRTEIGASVDPEDLASEPYTKYRPGDSITVPSPGNLLGWNDGVWNGGDWNEDADGETPLRVLAVALGLDDAGNPTWAVHLNSHIEEIEKRQQILLKRLAGGSVAGRSQTSTIPYEPRALQPREPSVVEWIQDTDTGIEIRESPPTVFARAVRIRELGVEVEPASSSGDVTVVGKKNGVVYATVTGAAGDGGNYEPVDDTVFRQRIDRHTIATTAVGTGVTKITVRVLYA